LKEGSRLFDIIVRLTPDGGKFGREDASRTPNPARVGCDVARTPPRPGPPQPSTYPTRLGGSSYRCPTFECEVTHDGLRNRPLDTGGRELAAGPDTPAPPRSPRPGHPLVDRKSRLLRASSLWTPRLNIWISMYCLPVRVSGRVALHPGWPLGRIPTWGPTLARKGKKRVMGGCAAAHHTFFPLRTRLRPPKRNAPWPLRMIDPLYWSGYNRSHGSASGIDSPRPLPDRRPTR
jgi:hypothetical protein